MRKPSLVIADDLTGSNDTGIKMSKTGLKTEVTLEPKPEKNPNSIVLDTESRTIMPNEAFNKVKLMTEKVLKKNDFQLVYKKIDSTLRGNIVEEVRAITQVYQPEKIIIAPAYPKIDRFTKDSVQFLKEQPLMQTEAKHDPLNPIWTDNIAELFQKEFADNITSYSTKQIREDTKLTDNYIHIFDIVNDQQFELLARSLLRKKEKYLYVGSAGFAEAIFKTLQEKLPLVAVIGSSSEKTIKQINYAQKQGVSVIELATKSLMESSFIERYKNMIVKSVQNKEDVILTVNKDKTFLSKKDFEVNFSVGQSIKETLAQITVSALNEVNIGGLFLSGGDTAAEVIKKLEGNGCLIEKELITGTVQSTLIGGSFDGLKLITKAGAFGETKDLYKIIKNFKT